MLGDIPDILNELRAFSDFYKTKMPMFRDVDHSTKVITDMINDHSFYVAVKHHEEIFETVGFIAGYMFPHIYNPDIKTLVESFWWVRPEHRRSGAGLMLLDTYIEFGKKNADWVIMTIEDETPIDPKLLIDRGFRLKETNYIMEVH